ncbi:MinD/ParA family protein [Mycobacterium sp. OTB74]|uniref:MinD/ParA family ATP-binding protein n=1 Tax=Mycobacterium sp. OTB74 TaxID=1853452 RepID=UPI0024758918|nr:MinD/ParA family protein [Mycobacterium sp. OTB74]MDH6244329.1 MinD-like ATPase involved in chromosome partitioning or flagellar assembly [Mycobacterium sp. OTB74]
MSADYDRLFNNSGASQADNDEATRTVDPATLAAAAQMSANQAAGAAAAARAEAQSQGAGHSQQPPVGGVMPPRATEVTTHMPPTQPQFMQNGLMRAPYAGNQAGAQYEQPRQSMTAPRHATPQPQYYVPEPQAAMQWHEQQMPDQAQTSAATIGDHRAIDALSHVGVRAGVKMPSQRGWRHWLYVTTRINLGLSPDELYELDLYSRIRRNARDSYQIGILGLKGGVGKTAVTVTLGSIMSKVRGDRILAVDADPDGGNLADRAGRQSAATISDLLSDKELSRYNDIRAYTSMNSSNLEVLSSAEYSVARRDFNEEDWQGAVKVVSQYYNLVLADCGAGLFHSASRAVLKTVSGLIIVASASIDGARQAAVTMDWLRQNGYQDLLSRACVVINHVTPGKTNIDVDDLVQQFERHVPAGRVIVLPWDKHVAAGSDIQLDLLGKTYQRRVTELAAALSDDFDRLERR